MAYRFFMIPAGIPGAAEDELNRFLRGQRVVAIERQFTQVGGAPVWCLAIEYVEAATTSVPGEVRAKRDRIDYKDVLSPEDFARYSRLRDLRKELAEAEGLPVYAIFTNEQLAAMAQTAPKSAAELQALDGVGEAKSRRYGERILQLLAGAPGTSTTAP